MHLNMRQILKENETKPSPLKKKSGVFLSGGNGALGHGDIMLGSATLLCS